MHKANAHEAASRGRLVAKVLRRLVSDGPFESCAELVGALKDRLAALRISASADDVNEALSVVGSNVQLLEAIAAGPSPQERRPEAPVIGRAEAVAICQQLGVRVRRMPQSTGEVR